MIRQILATSALVALTACGDGNPFFEDEQEENTTGVSATITGENINSDLRANSLTYLDNGTADPSDDKILINNLPFDNSDITTGGYTRRGPIGGSSFDVYESALTGAPNERQYFAVFKRSNFAEAAAVGTGGYVEYGFGGTIVQRIGEGRAPAPRAATYTFTGDYAAVRIRTDSPGGGRDDVTFVTGDARIVVDTLDFDNEGAVEGIINNRQIYDVDGVLIASPNDFIGLSASPIVQENGTVDRGVAARVDRSDNEVDARGSWSAVFAGPNGEEIAGFVFLEDDGNTGAEARETGAFIVVNGG